MFFELFQLAKNWFNIFWDFSILQKLNACFSRFSKLVFFRGVKDLFQSHSKGLYKDPNDCMNHPEWLFWSCETCLRHIRNHPTTEKVFLDYILESFRLKMSKNAFIGLCLLYKEIYYLFEDRNEEFRRLRSEYMTIIIS